MEGTSSRASAIVPEHRAKSRENVVQELSLLAFQRALEASVQDQLQA